MLYTGVLHKNEGFIFMISSMNAGMDMIACNDPTPCTSIVPRVLAGNLSP